MDKWTFTRRKLRDDDVLIQITYCGMCHSDLHQIRNEWGNSKFPMVPGHELMGVVIDTGKDVKKFKMGDLAAVGCMVDSCEECKQCKRDQEQYCLEGMVGTYNGKCAAPCCCLLACFALLAATRISERVANRAGRDRHSVHRDCSNTCRCLDGWGAQHSFLTHAPDRTEHPQAQGRRGDAGRVQYVHGGEGEVHALAAAQHAPPRHCAAPLRRHHHVLAHAPLRR